MLESIVKNRVVIENTLSCLRREKFDDDTFRSMGWIWVASVWEDFEHLSKFTSHVKAFVADLQAADCTLGHGLQKYIALRAHLDEVCPFFNFYLFNLHINSVEE